jgi:hypothetical protein
MAQRHEMTGTCPVCGDTMYVARLACDTCGSALEGKFTLAGSLEAVAPKRGGPASRGDDEQRYGRLARLSDAQIEFVEVFVRCRGIIKNVEDMLGISYPTVRARLTNVLEAMGYGPEDELPAAEPRNLRRKILADLAAGRISTEDAHRLLAQAAAGDDGDSGDSGDDE